MAKIFSFEEIQYCEIPSIKDFQLVAGYIRDNLEKPENSDFVVGGTLFGSAVYDAYTVRSDVDFFVIYDLRLRSRAMRIFQGMTAYAADFHVPLAIVSVAADVAQSPLHSIGTSFMQHLVYAAEKSGNVKGEDIRRLLSSTHLDWKEDERSYFRHKLRRFEKWLCDAHAMNENAQLHVIGKSLGVAIRTARKLLVWHEGPMPDDSKQEVLKRYPRIAQEEELEIFERLMGVDESYNLALAEQIKKPNKDRYDDLIQKMASSVVWDAYEFVRRTALRFTS